jgi:hypothetical protein
MKAYRSKTSFCSCIYCSYLELYICQFNVVLYEVHDYGVNFTI